MSVIIRNLAAGSLTNNTAALPAPAAGKSWIVKSIILTNRDSAARTVDIKVLNGTLIGSGSAIYIRPPNLSVAALSTTILNDEITLMNPVGASTLQGLSIGVTGTAATPGMDVVINGLERDV